MSELPGELRLELIKAAFLDEVENIMRSRWEMTKEATLGSLLGRAARATRGWLLPGLVGGGLGWAITGDPMVGLAAGTGAGLVGRSLGRLGTKIYSHLPGAAVGEKELFRRLVEAEVAAGETNLARAYASAEAKLTELTSGPAGARIAGEFAEAARPRPLLGAAALGGGALGASYLGKALGGGSPGEGGGGGLFGGGGGGGGGSSSMGFLPSLATTALGAYGTYQALKALGIDNPLLLYGGAALGGSMAPGVVGSIF